MAPKHVPPSTNLVSFNCPNCGAIAHQSWYRVHADSIEKNKTPNLWTNELVDKVTKNYEAKKKADTAKHLRPYASGVPFLIGNPESEYCRDLLANVHVSECYSCNKIAIWLHDKLVYPAEQHGPEPNDDLPEDVLRDYQEASTILNLSPRGAAALLRLCIQNICIYLGEKGKNLNADIGSLVKKGLDPRVKRSLDTVRVIGNKSVHPGQVELKDDRETASKLFNLVNVIVDITISQTKHIDALYEEKVPASKKKAIKKRDGGS